jgi:tetratricopeptide (TPR) repeat protein
LNGKASLDFGGLSIRLAFDAPHRDVTMHAALHASRGFPRLRQVTPGREKTVRRKLAALIVLASVAFATPAPAQNRAAAPLPAAQGASEKSLVAKAQAALDAKQWPDAEAALKQVTTSEPRWEYFEALGSAQGNQGHYADSIPSYQHALDLAQKTAAPPAAIGRIWTMTGNANLKLKKNDAAVAAYEKAAALDPNPATAYFNICATLYNAGETVKTLAACDRAIAADPKKADAYFVKGSVMVGQGVMKNGKMTVPSGTVETLKQYLVLAPAGGHADEVKLMLDMLK